MATGARQGERGSDQGLSWAECAEVLAGEGRRPKVDALMKRFERIKTRLGALARSREAE